MKHKTIEERFWSKVNKGGPVIQADDLCLKRYPEISGTRCWTWTAATLEAGYGVFQIGASKKSKIVRAHRLAYEIMIGPIDPPLHCLHKCNKGHKGCVNPYHLYLGTNKENYIDRDSDGKCRLDKFKKGHVVSEQHRNNTSDRMKGKKIGAILNDKQVRIIHWTKKLDPTITQKELSVIFGISQPAIHAILTGKRWPEIYNSFIGFH